MISVAVDSLGRELDIAPLRWRTVLRTLRRYVADGTAAAARELVTSAPGDARFHDAVQWRLGPFSGFVLGSYALARAVLPRVEAGTDLDLARGREYRSATVSMGFADEHGHTPAGLASMPAFPLHGPERTPWRRVRTMWRESLAPVDPARIVQATRRYVDLLVSDDQVVDVKQVVSAVTIEYLLVHSLGATVAYDDIADLAAMSALQERETTESFFTLFLRDRLFSRRTREFNAAKRRARVILQEALFDSGNPFAQRLLEESPSLTAAQTQVLHMVIASRGLGNSVYWALYESYTDPALLGRLRAGGIDAIRDHATHCLSRYPGAWINTRTPTVPLEVALTRDGREVARLRTGRLGKVVLSSYLWGQDPGIADAHRTRAAFGIGRRRCPGEGGSLEIAPLIVEHMLGHYDLQFPVARPSGHGFSLSPRPHSRAGIRPRCGFGGP